MKAATFAIVIGITLCISGWAKRDYLGLKSPPLIPLKIESPLQLVKGENKLELEIESTYGVDTSFSHPAYSRGNQACGRFYEMQDQENPHPLADRHLNGMILLRDCSLKHLAGKKYELTFHYSGAAKPGVYFLYDLVLADKAGFSFSLRPLHLPGPTPVFPFPAGLYYYGIGLDERGHRVLDFPWVRTEIASSSDYDNSPPEIHQVWFEPKDLKAGTSAKLFVKATDASGIELKTGPGRCHALKFADKSAIGDWGGAEHPLCGTFAPVADEPDVYVLDFTVPTNASNGPHVLSSLFLTDIHGNENYLNVHRKGGVRDPIDWYSNYNSFRNGAGSGDDWTKNFTTSVLETRISNPGRDEVFPQLASVEIVRNGAGYEVLAKFVEVGSGIDTKAQSTITIGLEAVVDKHVVDLISQITGTWSRVQKNVFKFAFSKRKEWPDHFDYYLKSFEVSDVAGNRQKFGKRYDTYYGRSPNLDTFVDVATFAVGRAARPRALDDQDKFASSSGPAITR